MSKKATGIVAYLSIIGWIIAFLAGDKEGAKFHLNQALVLDISSLVLSIITSFLGGIFILYLVLSIVSFVLWIFWLLGLIYAIQENEKEVPLIGHIKILN